MNGAIISHTPIAVDFWNVRETAARNCRLFFLSHAHADHTVGLTSSWKSHKIYCSELTKKIIVHKLGVGEEFVVGLPVDQPVVMAMDEVGNENLTVTLIDANHCPGAVLFLFQGYFGNILYTGDFRYYSSLRSHQALEHTVIDKLYLDNTYCDPKCVFPTREEATNMILEVIKKHLDVNIVFGMNTLGKEDLLAKVGITFQKWIGVEPKRMEMLKILDLPDVFTCDIESTSIRTVMRKEISKRNLEVWNDEHPTIAILPTALFEGETNLYQNMENVYVIPFSDHSSFDELVTFVSEVKPNEIVPLVLRHRGAKGDPENKRVNMNVFSSFLNKEPLSAINIPETVLQFMGARTKSKLRKRSKSFTAPKQKKRKCTGVVFSDEEENTTEMAGQDPCLEGCKKPENETDRSGKALDVLEQVDKANDTRLTNASPEASDVAMELVLKTSNSLEQVNMDQSGETLNKDTATSLEEINKDTYIGLPIGLKTEQDIKDEEDPSLQNSCVMEEVNECTCRYRNWNNGASCDVLNCEVKVKVENESRNFFSGQKENEITGEVNREDDEREGLSECKNGEGFPFAKNTSQKSKENGISTGRSLGDKKHLAWKLLEAFNNGQNEDNYTISCPVYKKFIGHFCEYLKTVVTPNETPEDENNQSAFKDPPRLNHEPKMESLHPSHQNTNFDNNDFGDTDSDSESGFNWFSSEF